jgi:glyceraldehyde 3-phosphate dehydrogenase
MKLAINGFGRIGRSVFKVAMERKNIEVVAINDITDAKTLAHLLKYDSNYGKYSKRVEATDAGLIVDGNKIAVLAERDPKQLPWAKMGVDLVIESTGIFRLRDQVAWHLEAGAKRAILTVPAKDKIDRMIVLGVNDDDLKDEDLIVSNASCTTNCLSPIAKVLLDNFGIVEGLMTTVHAYTSDQKLQDAPHSDLRRARAACLSIIPTSTGAAKAVGKVIPELNGKLNGVALRVPVSTGSLVDLTVKLEKDASVEDVNAAMKKAAEGKMKGILEYCEDPIVSVDIIGNTHSSIFDAQATMKLGSAFFKVFSWYDNEWGYSNRVVDLAERMM